MTPEQEALGLFEIVPGRVTHPLGDEHAAKILSGEISPEEARRDHEDRQRQAFRLRRARRLNQGEPA